MSSADTPNILLAIADGVAEVTFNRPDKLNSFTRPMHTELRAALDRAEQDEAVRAVLITGAGRGFCAGQDLASIVDPATGRPGPVDATIAEDFNPLIMRLQALPKPVVCAVNGVAAGAGANIALACDIVLAARSAAFIQAFSRIGLVPDSGGSYFLPRLVGTARAMALTMLGDKLPAEQAAQWGLIWRVVDGAELIPQARALAHQLASGPTRSLGMIKRMVHASGGHDLPQQLEMERDLQRCAVAGEDYFEGVGAFLQKRAPNFQGR
ncbi:MAG TPA: 2-(1,2-epoxy-1,2-dihydrophenyl)acetyl-CoA isomerase PaaG [Burkholderiales bacterium]